MIRFKKTHTKTKKKIRFKKTHTKPTQIKHKTGEGMLTLKMTHISFVA